MAATKNAARCSASEGILLGRVGDRHHVGDQNGDEPRGEHRLKPDEDREDGNLPRPENEHESREIERERKDPQERGGHDFRPNVSGHRVHQRGRHTSEKRPGRAVARGRPVDEVDALALPAPRDRIRTKDAARAAGDQDRERNESHRPPVGLLAQRQRRLDEERVGEQRSERPDVGGAIEDVRVLCVLEPSADEPGLHERRGRRYGEEGKPHRGAEQADQPEILPAGRGLVEGRRDRDRQGQEGYRQNAEMDHGGSDKVKVTG